MGYHRRGREIFHDVSFLFPSGFEICLGRLIRRWITHTHWRGPLSRLDAFIRRSVSSEKRALRCALGIWSQYRSNHFWCFVYAFATQNPVEHRNHRPMGPSHRRFNSDLHRMFRFLGADQRWPRSLARAFSRWTLPKLEAYSFLGSFFFGTIIAMGGYTACLGAGTTLLEKENPQMVKYIGFAASSVAFALGTVFVVSSVFSLNWL